MIVKKIPSKPEQRRTGFSRAGHARLLIDYLHSPEKDNPYREHLLAYLQEVRPDASAERLIHLGARNFVTRDVKGQRAEMMATAERANLSPNPMDHWLLSWSKDEMPTTDQIEQAVDMFMRTCRVANHQCVFAVHGDTHNRHLHIALNRYDPVTGRMTTIDGGWLTGAPHKAVALIEHRFGWKREDGTLYEIVNGRAQRTEDERARRKSGDKRVGRGQAASEIRTGVKSVQRLAIENALPAITSASSWKGLHRKLADHGFTYEPVGINGAQLVHEDVRVNSSSVSRSITLSRLEKRLGPFEPFTDLLLVADIGSRLMPCAFRADEYAKLAEKHRSSRAARSEDLTEQLEIVRNDLDDAVARVRSIDWEGGDAERRLVERALRRAAQAQVRTRVRRETRLTPDLESWLLEEEGAWFAERWRHRRKPPGFAVTIEGEGAGFRIRKPVDGYVAIPTYDGPEYCIRYARPSEPTAFIERLDRIDIVPGFTDDAIVAALKVAAQKFPDRIVVRGSDEVRARIHALAETLGLADRLVPLLPSQDRPTVSKEGWSDQVS